MGTYDPLTPFQAPDRVEVFHPDAEWNPMHVYAGHDRPTPWALTVGDPDDGGPSWAGSYEELAAFVERMAEALRAAQAEHGHN